MASPLEPLLSIIIVVLNDRDELDHVLKSVLPQKSRDVEIIVIDGGSNDGSVELLQGYGSEIDYWVSEPDRGLYDAMNKGIASARGRYLYHINAGDRLLYLPMSELRSLDVEQIDVASFCVSVDGKSIFHPTAGWRLKINNTLHHQGTFYRRSKFPGYDLRYKIFADFDANQRLAFQGSRIRVHTKIVASHSTLGVSHKQQNNNEMFRIVASNSGIVYVPISWLVTWLDCRWQGLKRRLARYAPE